MSKIKVGVLMGGMSIEREVSFNSGRTICDHLDTDLYEVIPLFQTTQNQLFILPWHFLHRGKITDFLDRLRTEAEELKWDQLKTNIDFLYIATHGRYAEDGTLQGFLEVLKIRYLGAKVLGSALGMNKTKQKQILINADIPVAHGITLEPFQITQFKKNTTALFELLKKENLQLPLVVKPNEEGSSLGVSIVFKKTELLPALEAACTIHKGTKQSVLIEEKLEGKEFSCITLFDKNNEPILLPPTEVELEKDSHFHTYEQKYMPGRCIKYTPGRFSEETIQSIQEICLKVSRLLEFETIARIDGFVTKENKVIIVDPNSLSGMAPSSFLFNQAAEIGMSHTDLINHLIAVELHKQGISVIEKKKDKKASPKFHVAVLLGGASNEREISLESGRNICYKLSPHKYEVTPIFMNKKQELYPLTQRLLVHNATAEIEQDLDRSTKINWHDLPDKFDFVFIALHGGVGENGSVQGTLEMLGLPYNGSGVLASALCMDKYKTNTFLQKQGFEVPKNVYIPAKDWELKKDIFIQTITETLQLPVIIKPHNDGCSVGVYKVTTKKELSKTIKAVLKTSKTDVLIEECIIGMELTVGVIGNEKPQALPPSQALTSNEILSIEEKFLPGAGQNLTPAPLPEKATRLIQSTVEKVYQIIGCSGYARIDCFYQPAKASPTKKERVIIIEVNTLPGMTPATCIFHQAAEIGIKPMDFIDLIINFGLQKRENINLSNVRGGVNEEKTVHTHAQREHSLSN